MVNLREFDLLSDQIISLKRILKSEDIDLSIDNGHYYLNTIQSGIIKKSKLNINRYQVFGFIVYIIILIVYLFKLTHK